MMIKLLEPEMVTQVARLEKESFSEPWSAQAFSDTINSKNARVYCIFDKDMFIGYVGLSVCMEEGEITNVAIAENQRGKGYGRKLMESVIEAERQKGVTKLFLEVRESNENAIRLYKSVGFKATGIRKNFYVKPVENAVLMERPEDN